MRSEVATVRLTTRGRGFGYWNVDSKAEASPI